MVFDFTQPSLTTKKDVENGEYQVVLGSEFKGSGRRSEVDEKGTPRAMEQQMKRFV